MNSEKIVALTFDDGPNLTTTPEVLDILEKYDIPASFFVCGSDMTKISAEEIAEEINFTSDAVEKAVGKRPEFFRPPYIAVNETMFDTIGMTFIQGAGAEDYIDEVSAEERFRRIIAQTKDGIIILLHDAKGNFRTVKAIDIIPKLKEDGYRFVTISGLFKEKNIVPVKGILYTSVFQTERYYH